MSYFKQRVWPAVLIVGSLVLVTGQVEVWRGGPMLFTAAAGLLSALTLWEYLRMVVPEFSGMPFFSPRGIFFLAVNGAWMIAMYRFSQPPHSATPLLVILVLLFLAVFGAFLFHVGDLTTVISRAALTFFGFFYCVVLLSFMVPIRLELAQGRFWFPMILFIVAGGDTFAFEVGRRFGRHKLYPAVSPNKSVEGALAGLAGGMLTAAALNAWWVASPLPLVPLLLLAGLTNAVAQVGDLAESLIKRAFQVKDSGTSLGGHGGFLDRTDACTFAAPVFYFALVYLTGLWDAIL